MLVDFKKRRGRPLIWVFGWFPTKIKAVRPLILVFQRGGRVSGYSVADLVEEVTDFGSWSLF